MSGLVFRRQGAGPLFLEVHCVARKVQGDKMPRQKTQAEGVCVINGCDGDVGVGFAVPGAGRQGDSSGENCLAGSFLQQAVTGAPGVDYKVGIVSEKARVADEGTNELAAGTYSGEGHWKGFTQFGGAHLLGTQKAHLPGFKIQLNAIVLKAVHAEDTHWPMEVIGSAVKGSDFTTGQKAGLAEVEPGRCINA